MKKITKNGWIEIGVCFGIFAIVAAVAALWDLQINKELYAPGCLYGQYFAKLGELPTYLTAPAVGVILFYQDFGRTKGQKALFKVAATAIVAVGYFFALHMWFWDNFIREDIEFSIVYKLVFTAFLTSGSVLGCACVPRKAMKKLFWFALFLAIVVAMSNLIVQIMKMLWSRQRFRTMTPGNASYPTEGIAAMFPEGYDYNGYTPWYIPTKLVDQPIRTEQYIELWRGADGGGIDRDAFKSFPSGHTVAASASFGLIILPEMFPKLQKKKWMFWVFPAIYTVLVAISRIVIAAHYLSDVLFGGTVGFATAALTRWIFVSKVKTLDQSEPTLAAEATEAPAEESKIISVEENV